MLPYSRCTTLCHHHRNYRWFATSSSMLCADHRLLQVPFSCHYSKSTMPAQHGLTKRACILHARMRLELSSKPNQILSRDTLLSVCAPTRCCYRLWSLSPEHVEPYQARQAVRSWFLNARLVLDPNLNYINLLVLRDAANPSFHNHYGRSTCLGRGLASIMYVDSH